MQTAKLSLALAIAFLAMSALRTGATCIAGIDQRNADASKFRLVLHERTQLKERPSRMFGSLLLAKPWLSSLSRFLKEKAGK